MVHAVEKCLKRSEAEHRVSVLYAIDAICRLRLEKYPLRFGLNMAMTMEAFAEGTAEDKVQRQHKASRRVSSSRLKGVVVVVFVTVVVVVPSIDPLTHTPPPPRHRRLLVAACCCLLLLVASPVSAW